MRTEGRPHVDTVRWPTPAGEESVLSRDQSCLRAELPASRTVRESISVLYAPPCVTVCYRLNAFVLKMHALKPTPQCVGIRRWDHQEVIRS